MIVFTGDIHAGASLRARHPQLAGDWVKALDALETAILSMHAEEGVSAVVMPGDVFHRETVNGEEMHWFRDFVEGLKSAGIRVMAIQGNHDWNAGRPMFASLGVSEITPDGAVVDGVEIRGVGFQPDPEAVRTAVRNCGPCDVLVVHSGFDWNLGYESAASLCDADFPAHIGLVVAGHVHVADRKGRMVSLGSAIPTSFAEAGARTVWTLDTRTRMLKPVEIPSRALAVVEVVGESDLRDLEDALADLSAAMDSGGPRGRLGAAVLVKLVPEMAQAVSEVERTNPGIVFCRGVISVDAVGTQEASEGGAAEMSDAVAVLIPADRPLVRKAAMDICKGVPAREAAASLRRMLEEAQG